MSEVFKAVCVKCGQEEERTNHWTHVVCEKCKQLAARERALKYKDYLRKLKKRHEELRTLDDTNN